MARPIGRPGGRARRSLNLVLTALALGFAAWYLARHGGQVAHNGRKVGAVHLLLGFAAFEASLVTSFLAWRALVAGMGAPVGPPTGARIFFVGQLGKYIPGTVWSVVSQADLAVGEGLPGASVAAAQILLLLISLTAALVIGLIAVPSLVAARSGWYLAAFALIVPLAALLRPGTLRWVLDHAMRLLRRPPLTAWPDGRVLRRVFLLLLASNTLLGVQAWLLTLSFGHGYRLLLLAVGGFVFASAVGFLAVPVPSGAGVREAVFAVILGRSLTLAAAGSLAVIARGLSIAGDLLSACVAALWARTAVRRRR